MAGRSIWILEIYTEHQIIPMVVSDLESAKQVVSELGFIGSWSEPDRENIINADFDAMMNGVAIEGASITEYASPDNPIEYLKVNLHIQVFEEVNIADNGDVTYIREVEGESRAVSHSQVPVDLRHTLKSKLLSDGFTDFSSEGYGFNLRRWQNLTDPILGIEALIQPEA